MDLKTRLKELERIMTEQKARAEWGKACVCFPLILGDGTEMRVGGSAADQWQPGKLEACR